MHGLDKLKSQFLSLVRVREMMCYTVPLYVELVWVVELTGNSHDTYVMTLMVCSGVQNVQIVHCHITGPVINFCSIFPNSKTWAY